MAENTETAPVEEALRKGGIDDKKSKKKAVPTYRVSAESRIPISPHTGKIWNGRRDAAQRMLEQRDILRAWREAVRYYRNDQSKSRDETDGDMSRNTSISEATHAKHSETENVVFANTTAMVPALYAKNPDVEVTATKSELVPLAETLEKLISTLFLRKAEPRVNIKEVVRKAIVNCALTNIAYAEVGYTHRKMSSEQAIRDLQDLSNKLVKAKNSSEVLEIEGQIEALERTVDFLQPSGPWCKFRKPTQVIRDPASVMGDFSDAAWIMIWEYVSTDFINAHYGMKKNNSPEYKSVYKPTHVLLSASGDRELDSEFTLISELEDEGEQAQSHGYNDVESYRRSCRTKVWYVWDKRTRRVLMFNDGDWSWPIWVWDDPYHLDKFFPVTDLTFYTDPEEAYMKGEVSYYLDQQDAINEINSEFRDMRRQAKFNWAYDKNHLDPSEAERIVDPNRPRVLGIDVPEGMELNQLIQSLMPPSLQYVQLFDKQPHYQAIDRISSVTQVMRGAEFRTNTTNKAIEEYNSSQQTRFDEKIDAVEEFIGDIGWMTGQMCLQFMPAEDVIRIIGAEHVWANLPPSDIAMLSFQVIGGSTQKPNSAAKQALALEMGQVLGQFVNAAPQVVLRVMLEVFRRAFDNVVIKDEDFAAIAQTMDQDMQQQQVLEMIDALPPEAKEALGQALAQGVPIEEAVRIIMEQMQQEGGGAEGAESAPPPEPAGQPAPQTLQ